MCPLEVYKTLINIVSIRYEKWRAVSWKGKLIIIKMVGFPNVIFILGITPVVQ